MTKPGSLGDRIHILGVSGLGRHGVFDHERRDGQEFFVDVCLEVDMTAAATSDDLADTIDYGHVGQLVVDRIVGEPVNLIEKLADLIAVDVTALPGVLAAEVTVHKPQAPMPVPFGGVSVTRRRRGMIRAVLGLGTNVGDRLAALGTAVGALTAHDEIDDVEVSSLFETAPVGGPEQPDFLNAVAVIRTRLDPWELLAFCHRLEAAAGRERGERWGPRTLDVDILDFGGQRWADPQLTLPHPRITERAFVLEPWAEIAPGDRPGAGLDTVAGLLMQVGGRDGVRRLPGLGITLDR